jgi:putative ABC transport system substrate-binding protein
MEELIRQRVDVIVLGTTDDMTVEAARVTRTVPMLFNQSFAPLELGLVDSYAKPGRNLTGTTVYAGPGIQNKRIEYLRAIAPGATRLFWLWGTGSASMPNRARVDLRSRKNDRERRRVYGHHRPRLRHSPPFGDADGPGRSNGLECHAVSGGGVRSTSAQQLIDFAAKARLPSVFSVRDMSVTEGCLSYGRSDDELSVLLWSILIQIQRVLRGVPVETIPVELPRRHNLCINLKTAKSSA